MSLKLNTRETQVKLPGFPAPGTQIPSPKNQLPGFKGVLSEGVVHWEFGPADMSLGLAELLRGGMFGSVGGVSAADRRAGRERRALGLWPALYTRVGPLSLFARSQRLRGRS